MHLVTYLHPRLPTDSAEEPNHECNPVSLTRRVNKTRKLFMQKPNRTMLTSLE